MGRKNAISAQYTLIYVNYLLALTCTYLRVLIYIEEFFETSFNCLHTIGISKAYIDYTKSWNGTNVISCNMQCKYQLNRFLSYTDKSMLQYYGIIFP